MTDQPSDAPENRSEIVLYQTDDGRSLIQVRLEDDTVWLSQALIAELFQTTPQNVTIHIQEIYRSGELSEAATCKESLQVRTEGDRTVRRQITYYNLDVIIAVGYRVKSQIATAFRQWATARLKEYIVKGFTLDDERLKGGNGPADYFDELLARIREIRASEARVYQRIREIFSLAVDYHKDEKETETFFAVMQNKMHFAATGLTAPEIIRKRADAKKPNMGLTTWKGSAVHKGDIMTAKNYLSAAEIDTLNRITVMFLDQAEFRAQRRQNIRIRDWEALLDSFLHHNELPVLGNAGSVSHEDAQAWSGKQYDAFAERRRKEAEAAAESRYIDDLRASAKTLEEERKQTTPKPEKPAKKPGKPRQGKKS